MKKFALIILATLPGTAFAFPIAAGAMGAGAVGMLIFPFALLGGSLLFVWKKKTRKAAFLLTAFVLSLFVILLDRDTTNEALLSANLFNQAPIDYLDRAIPFPFLAPKDQHASPQSVTPKDFTYGLVEGHFKALKISSYPSLFSSENTVSAQEIREDKDLLLDAVERLGGRVVLVDEYGGIAGSVAEEAQKSFGLNVGFLEGGTRSLSDYGWSLSKSPNSEAISVQSYQDWITNNPDAAILSITTDREFVQDGWIFGDYTMSLADLVTNLDKTVELIGDRKVFLASFETHDAGATPVVVKMLSSAGLDVTYVPAKATEVLIKPSYFKHYKNDDRLIGLNEAREIIRERDDVVFLDFSQEHWPLADALELGDRYRLLKMSDVAGGGLPAFIDNLDPTKTYIGLAFDRRTAYHSLLAGELLSKRSVAWLGRFTLPSVLTEEFFSNEDLTGMTDLYTGKIKAKLAYAGAFLVESTFHMLVCSLGLTLLVIRSVVSRSLTSCVASFTLAFLTSYAILLAAKSHPELNWIATYGLIIEAWLTGYWVTKWPKKDRSKIRAALHRDTPLPPKAALLNEASQAGAKVLKGLVFSNDDEVAIGLAIAGWGEGEYIVRSAAEGESGNHAQTAGIHDSIIVGSLDEIPKAVETVIDSIEGSGFTGKALVQPLCKADAFGVVQYLGDAQSGKILLEHGLHGAVTGGGGPVYQKVTNYSDRSSFRKSLGRGEAEALLKLSSICAYSIEFAIKDKELILLQVNADKVRACAEKRFADLSNVKVIEAASSHCSVLSAAIIAGLAAPGGMFAFGNRRFIPKSSRVSAIVTALADSSKLGLLEGLSLKGHIEFLHSQIFKLSQGVDCTDQVSVTAERVAEAVKDASEVYGRLNRIATTALAVGVTGKWEAGECLELPTSEIGAAIASGHRPECFGHIAAPLAGFNAFSSSYDFSADCLPTTVLESKTPAEYLKDASTAMMMVRLNALMPAIQEVIRQDGAQELLDRLATQAGYWDAYIKDLEVLPTFFGTAPLQDILSESKAIMGVMRIPSSGINGIVCTPEDVYPNGILFVDSCSMDYMKLLQHVKAIVVKQGAITSHLMQHAAFHHKPVVIAPHNYSHFRNRELITITKDGDISNA